jgi:glycolate oxidase iron-sulfur subunit
VSYHLNAQDEGLDYMRRNVDAWWPYVEQSIEAIVMTASGCGVMVKEYGHLLRHDARYADKAARISALTRDATEVLRANAQALEARFSGTEQPHTKVAFHSPCTLQHGQQIRGVAEAMLRAAGYALTPVEDGHLCCGSAGTYSILQPELSKQLLTNKVGALQSGGPDVIATANIGCLTHIQSGTPLPVRHWVELVEERLAIAPG